MRQYVLDVSLPNGVHHDYNGSANDMLVAIRKELDALPAPGAVLFAVMCSDVPDEDDPVALHALDVALDDRLSMVTPPWHTAAVPDIAGRDIPRKGGEHE